MTKTPHTMTKKRQTLLSATTLGTVAVLGLAGCGNGDDQAQADDLAAVTVPASPTADPSATTPAAASPTSDDSSGRDDGPTPPAKGPAPVLDTRADLDIEDQSGNGRTVRVRQIRLTDGNGFVVIRSLDGTVLGSAAVSRSSKPVSVRLDDPVRSTQILMGQLYADDGDGRFDPKTDPPVAEERDPQHGLEIENEDFTYRVTG